jgi:purine-binding chemotaxis protein CheW
MSTDNMTFLTFAIDEEMLAIPVSRVREILDARKIRSLPHAPDYVLGHIDLRGESILAIDLRLIMRRPYREDDPNTRLVVLWVRDGDKEHLTALRTDKVYEVTRFDDDKIAPLETGGILNWDTRMVRGIAHIEGQPITVLDPDSMFRSDVVADNQTEPAEPQAEELAE